MVSSNDILEFTLTSWYETSGNKGLNVFQYRVTGDTPFSLLDYGQDICNAWYAAQVALLQPITSTLVSWRDLTIVNLSQPLEIWLGIADDLSAGAVSGDCLPPAVSWGFILRRSDRTTRNGYKRFWGVPESLQVNGQPAGAAITALPVIADALGAALPLTGLGVPDISIILAPEIVRKDATGAMTLHQPVYDGQFRTIGTQNSRKFGRGM